VSHSGSWFDPAGFTQISDVQHFSNVVGTDCFTLIALCACYVLSDAAENTRLDSATYQRLALALVLYGGSTVAGVALAVAVGAVDPSLTPSPSIGALVGTAAAFIPAMAASTAAINAYGGGFGGAIDRAKDDFKVVTNLGERSEEGGYLEFYYKLSFWASMIVGGAFAFSPLSPLAIVNEYTPSSQIIQRAFGLGTVFMLAPAQFVLLDAASRGRLGGGTFKKLNLSIAAAIAGIDAMTIYTFGAAQMLNPDADALAEASGGVYNLRGRTSRELQHLRRVPLPGHLRLRSEVRSESDVKCRVLRSTPLCKTIRFFRRYTYAKSRSAHSGLDTFVPWVAL
jgi:hypothetical protein